MLMLSQAFITHKMVIQYEDNHRKGDKKQWHTMDNKTDILCQISASSP
jgi:hypothetical protein